MVYQKRYFPRETFQAVAFYHTHEFKYISKNKNNLRMGRISGFYRIPTRISWAMENSAKVYQDNGLSNTYYFFFFGYLFSGSPNSWIELKEIGIFDQYFIRSLVYCIFVHYFYFLWWILNTECLYFLEFMSWVQRNWEIEFFWILPNMFS